MSSLVLSFRASWRFFSQKAASHEGFQGGACHVSSWSVEACNQTDPYGIGNIHEDNWNCCRRRFCRQSRNWATTRNQDRDLAVRQFDRHCWQSIELVFCKAIFNCYILPLDIAGFL